MPELRRHSRAPLEVPVEAVVRASGDRIPGTSKDISLGGMQLNLHGELPFGEEIEVHLTLPGQNAPCTLPAVVRWQRANTVGVQFRPLGARETYAITELARER